MARMIDGSGGGSEAQNNDVIKFSAHEGDKIDVPGGEFIADATMTRDGQDLVLTAPGGDAVVIEGYFTADPAPVIAGPGGASLSPELVHSFLSAGVDYAQTASATDESPVGAVEEIKGNATVTRADGTTEPLALGSPIYEGDVISTDAQGAVNVVFVDETSMAVSANARMAIDTYSFDPATESGTTNFSVLRGVFVFTSGLIGRDDPDDVAIETPVGSIGIRGTIIAGNINPGGESEITVVEGAIVIKNDVMEKTLSQQFETIKLGGIDSEMTEMGVLSAKAVGTAFGAVSDVAPSLFSAINDAAKEQAPADAQGENANDGADESGDAESSETPAQETPQDAPQDMQMNDLNAPFKTNAFGEQPVKEAAATQTHATTSATDTTLATSASTKSAAGASTSATVAEPPPSVLHNHNNSGTSTDSGAGNGSGGNAITNPPPTALELTTYAATDGVRRIANNTTTRIGYTVTSVGDANGDGYADIMFSNDVNSSWQNHVYVAYGHVNGISDVNLGMPVIDTLIYNLNDPDADAGDIALLTNSTMSGDNSQTRVIGIGDFDGDGKQDYMISQEANDTSGVFGSGTVQIVSGTGNVITMMGINELERLGASIGSVGDLNNDGKDDIIIGAPKSLDFMFNEIGKAYVVYGGLNAFGTPINLPSMTGQGRVIGGVNDGDEFGSAVAGIGDFNGDGFNDYAIGASGVNGDRGMITFYSGNGHTPLMTINSAMAGHRFGSDIFNLGDINGDGRSDVMMAGEGNDQVAYILLSTGTTSISDINNASSAVVKIQADSGSKILGGGAVGDFNGDGFNDFAIAFQNGTDANIYVVYGSTLNNAIGGDGVLTMADLENPEYAFKMTYANGGNYDFDFSSAGDTNGDGFDDLVIGISNANLEKGEVYVVHGREGGTHTYVYDASVHDAHTGDNNIRASANNQIVMGTTQNDNIYADVYTNTAMNGGKGDDTLIVRDKNFMSLDGGFGMDTLRLSGAGSNLDLTAIGGERMKQIEVIQFSQTGQTIRLSVDNIFNLLKSSDTGTLKITYDSATGGSNGILQIDGDGTYTGGLVDKIEQALRENNMGAVHNGSESAGSPYEIFNIGGYTLYIEDSLMTNAQVV